MSKQVCVHYIGNGAEQCLNQIAYSDVWEHGELPCFDPYTHTCDLREWKEEDTTVTTYTWVKTRILHWRSLREFYDLETDVIHAIVRLEAQIRELRTENLSLEMKNAKLRAKLEHDSVDAYNQRINDASRRMFDDEHAGNCGACGWDELDAHEYSDGMIEVVCAHCGAHYVEDREV